MEADTQKKVHREHITCQNRDIDDCYCCTYIYFGRWASYRVTTTKKNHTHKYKRTKTFSQ